jgi:hypothetical protein
VVVPSKRVNGHLDYAASLAHEWDCPLLVLADAAGPRWNGITARNRGRTVTVAVPPLQSTPQFEFATNQHPVAISPRDLEVSAKRNVGLLLARLLGWRTILFLDDDARSLEDVRGTLASLGRARAAGWRMTHFPDNSVVCHANRLSGGLQGVFAGAGALVIQTEGCLPFFPAVYNEEWLFLYHWLARDAVLDAGEVRQIPYDPFADPERAAREEFGDILGEGLFQLLHDRRSARTASRAAYWAAFQDRRHMLIDRIEAGSRGVERSGNVWAVRRSLAAARCRSEAIRPESLAEYVDAWRGDLHAWNGRLARLPRLGPAGGTGLPRTVRHVIDSRAARTAWGRRPNARGASRRRSPRRGAASGRSGCTAAARPPSERQHHGAQAQLPGTR